MLGEERERARRYVVTDSLQISIGEIASMYEDKEIDIMPEFQRLFRWPIEKKTAFIESILIGIPIPPAFTFEKQDGTWELIDGLQRISTVLEFMGVLRDPDDKSKFLSPSTLCTSTYLPSLEGIKWKQDKPWDYAMEKKMQLFFRRARLDFQVLKHPSDSKTKFDLFRRLNRGGEYANEQEVRTCSMVLANPNATKKIRKLAKLKEFFKIINTTDDQREKQKDLEYVVRTMVHSAIDFKSGMDVQEFFDTGILQVITEEDYDEIINKVKWVIKLLYRLYGSKALRPHDEAYEGIAPRFSLRALECILVGIARNKDQIEDLENTEEFIRERIDMFWRQEEVAGLSTPGLRGTTRIQRTVPFGDEWFKPND